MENDKILARDSLKGEILLKQFDGIYYSPSLDNYFIYNKNIGFIPKFIPDITREVAHLIEMRGNYYLVGNKTNRKFPILNKTVLIPKIEIPQDISKDDIKEYEFQVRFNMSQEEINERIKKQLINDKDKMDYSIDKVIDDIKNDKRL